jgi:actin related protein 2/3 complex subunit 3
MDQDVYIIIYIIEQMRQYMQQLRQELASRLVERVYDGAQPSKWWMCFSKRKFMNLSL